MIFFKRGILFTIMIAVYLGSFSVAFWIIDTLFHFSDASGVRLWVYLVSCLLGTFILLFSWRHVGNFLMKSSLVDEGFDRRGNSSLNTLIRATEKIAHGDFSVLIPVDERGPYREVAQSINNMAKNLGTMEEIRQSFISNVSHELQSPLTSIQGFAALLKSDTLSSEETKHYLNIIETEAKRLSQMSDHLLKLSTLESEAVELNRTTFRLDKQIKNVIFMLEPQWSSKKIEISADMSTDAVFFGDQDLLTQVWVNLLGNAIKFTPIEGQIEVQVTLENDEIVCKIKDNGMGISQEDQMHIFERFYKVDQSRDRSLGGNGLGLSLVKKIISLHEGQVMVDSTEGVGSTFTIKLKKPVV